MEFGDGLTSFKTLATTEVRVFSTCFSLLEAGQFRRDVGRGKYSAHGDCDTSPSKAGAEHNVHLAFQTTSIDICAHPVKKVCSASERSHAGLELVFVTDGLRLGRLVTVADQPHVHI